MLRFTLAAMLASASLAWAADPFDDLRKPVLRPAQKQPAKLPEGLTGKVVAYQDGSIALNLGLDAGLTVGAKMDIIRGEGKESRRLGEAVIERVYPKEAVAKFTPASGRDRKDLKADELPKPHDLVGTYKGK